MHPEQGSVVAYLLLDKRLCELSLTNEALFTLVLEKPHAEVIKAKLVATDCGVLNES